MMERVRLNRSKGGGAYFTAPNSHVEFIPSGCKLLDLALGGGWAEGRIANIVGDKSTGKTLLWIEAAANFIKKHPHGVVRVRETEAAFDEPYAQTLGLPLDRCEMGKKPLETVEDMYEDMEWCLKRAVDKNGKKVPQLYVVDSLDALSDRGEMDRDMDKGSFGAEKAKIMSEVFRRLNVPIEEAQMTVIIISQIRDKIGVTFGRKWKRSGGKALDFYASQVVMLSEIGKIYKTVSGIKRPIGIDVKAKIEKNKISMPYREAEFSILFGYGTDDYNSCMAFLKQVGKQNDVLLGNKLESFGKWMEESTSNRREGMEMVHAATSVQWYALEDKFIRHERKYS